MKKHAERNKQEQISYTMSHIRSKDSKIEVKLRKAVWHKGIRYRKNYKELPGKPDIALTKFKIAIFCDGEFWHGKNWGEKKEKLSLHKNYWVNKIELIINRDIQVNQRLEALGWQVVRFWGDDIEKDVDGCVEVILEKILQKTIQDVDDKRCGQYDPT